jgi:hypothetical protein
MHDILSDSLKIICREVDTVFVKGSKKPMKLFTVDISSSGLTVRKDPMLSKPLRQKKY